MRLVKLFFTIVLLGVILWFLALNVDTTVRQIHLFTFTVEDINLVHVILASFLFGVLIGFFIPVLEVISTKAEARKLERENKKLHNELNDLRNVAIEEDLDRLPARTESSTQEDEEKEQNKTVQ